MMDPFDGTHLHARIQRRRRFRRCIMCVMPLACMFVSGLSLVASLVYTQNTLKNFQEDSDSFKRQVMAFLNQIHPDDTEATETVLEMIGENPLPRNPRSLRATTKKPKNPLPKKYPPYIHLTGREDGRQQEYKGDNYFVWQVAPSSPGTQGFNLIPSEYSKSFYKIGILESGVYLVYSQVAVHGRDNVSRPYECSHETVRITQDRTEVLLKSLVTQYNLGGKFEGSPNSVKQNPMDSKLHMGVFLLHNEDYLAVKVPKSCESMNYYMPESYFGVVKIASGGKNPTQRPVKTTPPTPHRTRRPVISEA